MKRREFFGKTALGLADTLLPPSATIKANGQQYANQTIPTGLTRSQADTTPYSGAWGNEQVKHLLRRTLFGAKPADIEAFKQMGVSAAVDALLNVSTTPPSPPINAYNDKNFTDPDVPAGQTWINATPKVPANGKRIGSFKSWWLGLMLNQEATLLEKMTLFWDNHFSTQTQVVKDCRYIYYHNAMLRANALGNFRTLVKAVTTDMAMLIYLNGNANTKAAPDENYGRELQELFTIGKGLDSHYTEADVKAAAHVLTGWRVDRLNPKTDFNPLAHDTSDKQFSAFYNNTLIKGQSDAAGANETDALIDMILATNECAKYICRCFYRYFVYYVIDDATEANVISPLADTFRNNNYEIKPVLSQLFKSDHFYDSVNMGCMIKNPVDLCVGTARILNMKFPDSSDYNSQYATWNLVRFFEILQGMDVNDPPNVAGWPAYYQEPQYYELWINSDTLPRRNEFTDVAIYGYKRGGYNLAIDILGYTEALSNPGDPNVLIADLAAIFYQATLNTNELALMKNILLSGQLQDHYWTDAWTAYEGNPNDAMNKNIVLTRLQSLYKYMLELAEYQLS